MANTKSLEYILASLKSNKAIEFTEDEVRNFYVTFCKTILDANPEKPIEDTKDSIYKATLEYFANGKTDAGSKAISLILGTEIYAETTNTVNSCSCNTNKALVGYEDTVSCSELYAEAMEMHMKHMLGDQEFYWRWMYTDSTDGTKTPNAQLIESLKSLIEKFLALGIDLSFSDKGKYWCTYDVDSDPMHVANTKTMQDYILVLNWLLKECGLENNKNKIKHYGEKFGSLLGRLQFI